MEVFAPWVTNKRQGSAPGLFIAQSIMSAHGGTITYTTQKGEGTAFPLTFPIGGNDSATGPQRPANAAGIDRL